MNPPWMTVVGVVADLKRYSLTEAPRPEMIVPYTQKPYPSFSTMQFVVRSSLEPAQLLPALKSAIASVDPGIPISRMRTIGDLVAETSATARFAARAMTAFAASALLLAMIGLGIVIAYGASSSAVRSSASGRALGAAPHEILQHVLLEGLRLAAIGVAMGVVLSVVAGPHVMATLASGGRVRWSDTGHHGRGKLCTGRIVVAVLCTGHGARPLWNRRWRSMIRKAHAGTDGAEAERARTDGRPVAARVVATCTPRPTAKVLLEGIARARITRHSSSGGSLRATIVPALPSRNTLASFRALVIQLIPWVNRTWVFGLPVGAFPAVLERLRGTPARAAQMVAGLSDDALSGRTGQSWSVKQHLGHLDDLHELDESRLQQYIERAPALIAADMQNRRTREADQHHAAGRRHRVTPSHRAGSSCSGSEWSG